MDKQATRARIADIERELAEMKKGLADDATAPARKGIIGETMRDFREKVPGLKAIHISKALEMSHGVVSCYERGGPIPFPNLVVYAKYCGVKVSDIVLQWEKDVAEIEAAKKPPLTLES